MRRVDVALSAVALICVAAASGCASGVQSSAQPGESTSAPLASSASPRLLPSLSPPVASTSPPASGDASPSSSNDAPSGPPDSVPPSDELRQGWIPTPLASSGSLALVGTWRLAAAGELPGTVLVVADQFTLLRPCGEIDGVWDGDAAGDVLVNLDGVSGTCEIPDTSSTDWNPPWLEHAVRVVADGSGRELLDATGAVVARLTPGAAPSTTQHLFVQPLSPSSRSRLLAPVPAPPAGSTRAASPDLTGSWIAAVPAGNPAGYVRFKSDGSFDGYDGCNDFGGRWHVADGGSFIMTAAPEAGVGCNSSMIDLWVAQSRGIAVSNGDLLLLGDGGKVLGSLKPRPLASPYPSQLR